MRPLVLALLALSSCAVEASQTVHRAAGSGGAPVDASAPEAGGSEEQSGGSNAAGGMTSPVTSAGGSIQPTQGEGGDRSPGAGGDETGGAAEAPDAQIEVGTGGYPVLGGRLDDAYATAQEHRDAAAEAGPTPIHCSYSLYGRFCEPTRGCSDYPQCVCKTSTDTCTPSEAAALGACCL